MRPPHALNIREHCLVGSIERHWSQSKQSELVVRRPNAISPKSIALPKSITAGYSMTLLVNFSSDMTT